MTPLWARMLVFKAWENKEITEECAHYFDKLLLDGSKGIDVDRQTFYYDDMQSVLNNIGDGHSYFNLLKYIEKIHFDNGKTESLHHPTDVYLFEITKIRIDYVHIILEQALNAKNLNIEDLVKIEAYFDRLCVASLITNPNTIRMINKKIAGIRANIETYVQSDVNK